MKRLLRIIAGFVILSSSILACHTALRGTEDGYDRDSDSAAEKDVELPEPYEKTARSDDPEERGEEIGTEDSVKSTTITRGALRDGMGTEDESPSFLVEDEVETSDDSVETTKSTILGTAGSSSGLRAGFSDDNRQYGYFVKFLKKYSSVNHIELPIEERIFINVVDINNKPLPNAVITINAGYQVIVHGKTTADGRYQFNPSEFPNSGNIYQVISEVDGIQAETEIDKSGSRSVTMQYELKRTIPDPVPLDIVFILDTTGSMGEEILRLRATIELIYLNLANLDSQPHIRFGMVLYKDIDDEYDTKMIQLTESLEGFSRSLNQVEASGGGDTPENLQAALELSMRSMNWNTTGVRLGFIITDAPPHLDYEQAYTYVDASRDARSMGIKFFGVGTGGLPLSGEYVLRQIAQYTGGKYIFLTYGETGESEGGSIGSVSHHTGANYQTDKLEAIIIRIAKEELNYLSDRPLLQDEPYLQAVKISIEEREETLTKLFRLALEQLVDYSTYVLDNGTVAAVLPIDVSDDDHVLMAEYLTEQLVLTASNNSQFVVVDRSNLNNVIDELKLQLSGLTDTRNVTSIGKLLNAEVLIGGKLYFTDHYELYLRLLRVENGELLSLTKAVIDSELGI